MNTAFQGLMAEAARLTRSGDLQQATAAIQAALAGHAGTAHTPWHPHADIIDIEAVRLDDGPPVAEPPHAAPAPQTEPGDDAGRVLSGSHTGRAGTRDYKLYVPPGAEGRRLPLVVMLHGCQQDPDDFAAGTAMNEAARRLGVLVLYPAQAQKVNPQRCWNWFKRQHQGRGRGEPDLLAGMTREVMQRHGVDADRVYVAGLSAGGAMAAILGAAYPELYAAVGVHSGLPAGAAGDLPSALAAMRQGGGGAPAAEMPPTIVFHGDRDATVHPVNGEQVAAASAGATAARTAAPQRSSAGRMSTRHEYRDAEGRVKAEHWVVHGAGHAWSGGRAAGSYTDPSGPDATQEMLRFFLERSRRAA